MNFFDITPHLTFDSANQNHPVSLVYVQEQNSLASDLTTSNATATSNQTASMSLNVEQFPSLEAFYSVLCNAAVGNSGLQLRDTVEESVQSAALSLLPEYVAGNGCIAPDRMASSVQGIQRIVENFQSRNIGENENTIFVINEFLIEWAIKSTIVKKMNLLLNGLSCQPL